MQLIGRTLSPFVRRVALAMDLGGIPYEQLALSTANDADKIKEFNPLSRVPALVLDSGERIIDSAAILDYLDGVIPAERAITPPHGADRRLAMMFEALMLGAAEKAISGFYETFRKPADKHHIPFVEGCMAQCHAGLATVESMLNTGQTIAVGSKPTRADIAIVAVVSFLEALPKIPVAPSYPKLGALAAALEARPEVAKSQFKG
jgi:glutathione S-transferase